MKIPLFRFTFFLLVYLALPLTATGQVVSIPEPVPPPFAVREVFELDPFYQQWIDVEGFPVVASEKVNPYALKEAAWLIWQMIGHRPDVLQALVQRRVRFTVIAYTEMTTDIPEYNDRRPAFYWDRRQRGLGGSGLSGHPAVSCAEENLLDYPGDTTASGYQLIHEFSHAVHKMGLNVVDPAFDNRLGIAYEVAIERGLWQSTYSALDKGEYWAQGAWYFFNRETTIPGTGTELKNYDPDLNTLLTEIYGDSGWRYTPPATRTHLPHLQGFNPQDSPTFEWPEDLEKSYAQLKDPDIDGNDEWVNLNLYDPSLLSQLHAPRTRRNRTEVLFINLTGIDILVYLVRPDRTETFVKRFPANRWHVEVFRTDAGRVFIVKDSTGNHLAVFQTLEKTGRVLIDAAPTLITPGLSKISGDNQTGVSGTALANPFVIEVRDESSSVLEGISVTFAVTAGGGTLNATRTTTNASGRAQSTLTLGINSVINSVEVSAAGATVTFNAVAEPAVNIPDANLRAAIETALGKVSGAPITADEMATLTHLEAPETDIRDLTGLEGATNLTRLELYGNSITDTSALATLANLTHLVLYINSISDPLSVAGLTELTYLNLAENSISDISALVDLTNLTHLELPFNSISDLSPLVANTGLGSDDEVDVRGNPLSYLSIHTHIPTLKRRGVTVEFDNRTLATPRKISGDDQQGTPGTVLERPFVVEVRDASGSAFEGVPVTFTATAGGGTLSGTSATTDSSGRAESTLTLGPIPGTNTVTVSVAGIQEGQTFNAEGIGVPKTLEIVSGDDQEGLPGAALDNPFVVEVRNQSDKPLPDAQVTFSVTAGGGTLSATSATTESGGRAESTLTLGPNPGTNTVTVSVTGIQAEQTFTAEGIRIPKTLEIISGKDQEGLPGEALAKPFVVEVRDQSGEPLPDAQVTFSVTSGGGTLSLTSATTDSNGRAESTLTLGPAPGTNTVTVSAGEIQEDQTFFAEGIRIPLAFWIISGDDQQGLPGAALENPFVVEVRDRDDTPVPGVQVTFSVNSGGGTLSATSVTTNSGGRAESILTLGPKPGTNTVKVGVTGIQEKQSVSAIAELPPIPQDVNRDDVVNILDLVLVASVLGDEGRDLDADVNRDGVVNILDLVLVAGALGNVAAAPSANPRALAMLTATDVGQWLAQAQPLDLMDTASREGVLVLEQLLAVLAPKETILLPNYPNPFNPETWIPYKLAKNASVTLTIYDTTGVVVRRLDLGHRMTGFYESRSKAIYWDGKNGWRERVASGIYFYTLKAGGYSATRKMVILQ